MKNRAMAWLFIFIPSAYGGLQGASFTCSASAVPQSGQAVLPVQCRVAVQGGSAPYRYSWDFNANDGLQTDKAHSDPSFVYGRPGAYVITVTVQDRRGETAADTIHVSVQPRSYIAGEPVVFSNRHHTSSDPLIIEGLEITNPDGCGIRLESCSHVIIRNCYIHHVNSTAPLNEAGVDAIWMLNCSDILIENCLLEDNIRGILADAWGDNRNSRNITVRHCVVDNCVLDHGIHLKETDGISVDGNVLRNNGDPAYFERHRITGIICWSSHRIRLHDNLVIGSSSDGLGVSADNVLNSGGDPEFISDSFEIDRNTSRNNGEQGIWLSVARNGDVHDNFIEGSASCGICLEYRILGSQVRGNTVCNSGICGINVNQSVGNSVYENVISEPDCGWGAVWVDSQKQLQIHRDYPVETRSNIIRNNVIENSVHGIWITAGDSTFIVNNTVYDCGPFHRNQEAGISVDSGAGFTLIKNNILVANHGRGISCYNEQSVYCYNDVLNETIDEYLGNPPGEGALSVDPLFESALNHDFHLTAGSPCVNAGDPSDDYQNEPEPNGGRIDMGAYGNTSWAAVSEGADVHDAGRSAGTFHLYPNFPNPFNPRTTFQYQLPSDCHVTLKVYNLRGETVASLADGNQQSGFYQIHWDGRGLASGIYVAGLSAVKEGVVQYKKTKKMSLIK